MRLRLALIVAAASALAAQAAELPSRRAQPKTDDKLKTCEIAGERGFALPGGGCVKVGGEVDVGVSAGVVRH